MMLHQSSLLSSLYLFSTPSFTYHLEQQFDGIGSSWPASSLAQRPQQSCGEVSAGPQSRVLADQGDLLLMTSVSQMRKPQDVTNVISEEILKELGLSQHQSVQLSDSLEGVKANESSKPISSQLQRTLNEGSVVVPMLPQQTISSGVTPTGELAHVDSHSHTRQVLNSSLDADPREEVLVQTQLVDSPKKQKPAWFRSKQLMELLQTALLQRSESIGEGVMLFFLCNVFLCALVSGICLLWRDRNADTADLEGVYWPQDAAAKKGKVENRGIGALEERRSHALVQKQAPSARPSMKAPRSSSDTPNGPNTPSGPARQLCPELVVPLGSECILAVRCMVSSQTQHCDFEVLDINGKAVLRVEVTPQSVLPRNSHGPPQRTPTITLKALQPREMTGGMVLAYCCSHSRADDGWNSSSGKRNVCIYNDSDELFAHIVKDEARHRYVLTSGRPGLQLLFEGNFEERAVDVANEARELLAATEPSAMPFDPLNKYFKLRVAADVDVGLVLCGLLAIDQIEIK